MTEEQLFDGVVIDGTRDLASVVCWLTLSPGEWCVIGGHAANSYTPTALYDAHLDIALDREPGSPLLSDLTAEGFAVRVDARAQVVRLTRAGSGHRLQITINHGPAYQGMPRRASYREVLGCRRPVASLPDVEQGLLLIRDDPRQGWHARGKAELDLARLAERTLACADADGWGDEESGIIPRPLIACQ